MYGGQNPGGELPPLAVVANPLVVHPGSTDLHRLGSAGHRAGLSAAHCKRPAVCSTGRTCHLPHTAPDPQRIRHVGASGPTTGDTREPALTTRARKQPRALLNPRKGRSQ